jgi:hypothetical protein
VPSAEVPHRLVFCCFCPQDVFLNIVNNLKWTCFPMFHPPDKVEELSGIPVFGVIKLVKNY